MTHSTSSPVVMVTVDDDVPSHEAESEVYRENSDDSHSEGDGREGADEMDGDNSSTGDPDDKTPTKEHFNANTYASKKTISQGMLDVALLTANSSHLKLLCQSYVRGDQPLFFVLLVTLLSVSMALQVVVGVLLLIKLKCDIVNGDDSVKRRADRCNDAAMVLVMFIVIVNILIASFSSDL
ncbi:ninjurin-2-like [Ptychodera flava]|uniref:ninjurin-2-like n=1 Tax=Ptychodera flava TaxID=63121 RepID=UPI00396A0D95